MNKKLRNSRGETLVEVLASVLICSLSILLLFGSVMASGNLDRQAQELDAEYYADLSAAEGQTTEANLTGGSLAVTNEDGASKSITPGGGSGLRFYGTEHQRLLSYAISGTGGGG